jgi:hypothetical protein
MKIKCKYEEMIITLTLITLNFISCVDTTTANPESRVAPLVRVPPKVQNTDICFEFLHTALRSSDRRQYSGSLLRCLGIISLKITDRRRLSSSDGGWGQAGRGGGNRLSTQLTESI